MFDDLYQETHLGGKMIPFEGDFKGAQFKPLGKGLQRETLLGEIQGQGFQVRVGPEAVLHDFLRVAYTDELPSSTYRACLTLSNPF
jgi:hypothetical protein